MRRLIPPVLRTGTSGRFLGGIVAAVAIAFTAISISLSAQIPGRNVNMVSGHVWPDGDPFLQRQNEPSLAASTRNPLHLVGGSNDYRTVDLPFPDDGDEETGDAWLGLFKSFDGGQRWISTLLPGYPQDDSPAGLASPLRTKGYQAGADPVVRAGTSGLIYYNGLAFDRTPNGKSGIFLARFIDNNNKENGDPIAYLGTTMVAESSGSRFFDKPWMAVDVPRGDAPVCVIGADNTLSMVSPAKKGKKAKKHAVAAPLPPAQRIPAGAIYVAFSSITGEGTALRSEILLTRSMDCGATWSTPMKVSRPEDPINQGATIAIDPRLGTVFVAWRRFSAYATAQNPNPADADAVMVATLPYGGKKVDPPGKAYGFPAAQGRRTAHQLEELFEHRGKKEDKNKKIKSQEASGVAEFDQGSSAVSFRSNAYPTIAADGTGRVYLAWTTRGFPADSAPGDGARIVITTTRDGRTFTQPRPVDDRGQLGHQLMPSLAFAGGKLMLAFYDLRETRANTHGRYVTDANTNSGLRQTIDIRSAMALPGDYPQFAPSVKVSDYLMGINTRSQRLEPLQVNPPNLPMFRQGTTPFMGDYIDIAAAPAFVPVGAGKWAFNTAGTTQAPVFHAAWTDNRDVRPPANGDWTKYTPARISPTEPAHPSKLNPAITVPDCEDGNAGSRNQNVYSARITGGLLAGSPGNSKPLSTTLQRAFVVFAQNATAEMRRFRMTIRTQPPGGRASFDQFAPAAVTNLEMNVPPRSTATRTVYATSSDRHALIPVDVVETTPAPASLGLSSTVLLNPDVDNPDLVNPDIDNGGVSNTDITNAEVYTPDIDNPDIDNPNVKNPDIDNVRLANPDIDNPDIDNPDIDNPDIDNVRVANPDIDNLSISNPDIDNPDIDNPDIDNPDIDNPDIDNGSIADVTWQVSNTGNTTSAFNVNVFLAQQQLPAGVKTQLILFKTYRTPVTVPNGCQLGFQVRNVLLDSILHPNFILPSTPGVPDQNDSSEKNASMWLAPGEEGRVTLRVISDDLPPNYTFTNADGSTKVVRINPAFAPNSGTTLSISSQGVDTTHVLQGDVDPPLVTPTGANLFFLQMPLGGVAGAPISPSVSVQVRDNLTGTPIVGAAVTLSLGNNPSNAVLSGAVATSGVNGIATFPSASINTVGEGFTIRATAVTPHATAIAESAPFNVVTPITIAMPTQSERTAQSAVAYALALNASGGTSPYTWSVVSGALPAGLSLSAGTGVVSGTPTTPGAFTFTVRATDQGGASSTLTLCITVASPVSTNLATAAVGDAGITVQTLVESLLGDGVAVSNVVLKGAAAGAGVFEGGAGILGFDTGIVLSSGNVNSAPGPNNSDSTTTVRNDPGDPDLDALSGQPTHDASVIEFDFVPTSNQVSFRYVFGSEEYNEFVASAYNDAFGFFITGPDNVKKNWALVPGTNQQVSINTISGGNPYGNGANAQNANLFRNNDLNDTTPTINIQADGLTVVLTLTATVVPNQTHHMKLAIADANDLAYDSWVFIEGRSFHAVENCSNGIDDDGDGLVDGADNDCQACAETFVGQALADMAVNSCTVKGSPLLTTGKPTFPGHH
jgi:hypothetical protein